MKGLVSQTLNWLTSASYSEGTTPEWLAGLGVILVLSFLWSMVVKEL